MARKKAPGEGYTCYDTTQELLAQILHEIKELKAIVKAHTSPVIQSPYHANHPYMRSPLPPAEYKQV